MSHGLFNDMPSVRRAPEIMKDFKAFWPHKEEIKPKEMPVVKEYLSHIKSIMSDKSNWKLLNENTNFEKLSFSTSNHKKELAASV